MYMQMSNYELYMYMQMSFLKPHDTTDKYNFDQSDDESMKM